MPMADGRCSIYLSFTLHLFMLSSFPDDAGGVLFLAWPELYDKGTRVVPPLYVVVPARYAPEATIPPLCIAATGTTPHTAALVNPICVPSDFTAGTTRLAGKLHYPTGTIEGPLHCQEVLNTNNTLSLRGPVCGTKVIKRYYSNVNTKHLYSSGTHFFAWPGL